MINCCTSPIMINKITPLQTVMQQATQEESSMDMGKEFFTKDLSDKTMDDKFFVKPVLW